MEQFENLNEIIKTVRKNIFESKKEYLKNRQNEKLTPEEEDFIFKNVEEIEKASKKNLKKLDEIEEFLKIWLY